MITDIGWRYIMEVVGIIVGIPSLVEANAATAAGGETAGPRERGSGISPRLVEGRLVAYILCSYLVVSLVI